MKSYTELTVEVTRLANALQGLGLTRGGPTWGVMSVNSAEYVVIYYACAKLGVTFVPLNYRAKREELTYMINTAEAKVIFVSDRYQPLVDAIAELCPSVEHYISLEVAAPDAEALQRPAGAGLGRFRLHGDRRQGCDGDHLHVGHDGDAQGGAGDVSGLDGLRDEHDVAGGSGGAAPEDAC